MVKSHAALEKLLLDIFTAALGVLKVSDFGKKFEATFSIARMPVAILTYVGKLKQLPEREKSMALKGINTFAEGVLERTYPALRYVEQGNPHLEKLTKEHSALFEAWKKSDRASVGELLPEAREKEDVKSNHALIQSTLFLAICQDKHINPTTYAYLAACLEKPSTIAEQVEALENEQRQLTEELERRQKEMEASPEIVAANKRQKCLALQSRFMKVLSGQLNLLPACLEELRRDFPEHVQFIQDIADLNKTLMATSKSLEECREWTVVDDDHWEDRLLAGTEVSGSCQRIDGEASLNKCLLGYLLDGKIRMVALKDKSGRIMARCIMRLLFDDRGHPVIFQERLYQNPGIPPLVLSTIHAMFLRRAISLHVPLVTSSTPHLKNAVMCATNLSSLGGGPFEYVDAGGIGCTHGIYTIPKEYAHVLFKPSASVGLASLN